MSKCLQSMSLHFCNHFSLPPFSPPFPSLPLSLLPFSLPFLSSSLSLPLPFSPSPSPYSFLLPPPPPSPASSPLFSPPLLPQNPLPSQQHPLPNTNQSPSSILRRLSTLEAHQFWTENISRWIPYTLSHLKRMRRKNHTHFPRHPLNVSHLLIC